MKQFLCKEWRLIVVAAISLVGAFIMQCCFADDNGIATNISIVLVAICTSCFAGSIFYLFTSVIPYYRKHESISKEITELYRAISERFRDLSGELAGGDWLEDEKYRKEAIECITTKDANSQIADEKTRRLIAYILYSNVESIDSYLANLVNFYEYIDYGTINILIEMKTSKSLQLCRMQRQGSGLLKSEVSTQIVDDLIRFNKLINNKIKL